jgi:hypothetical protein
MQRKKVMVFCDYYLPGFKERRRDVDRCKPSSRGSADIYEFYVVTRNHDGKADRKAIRFSEDRRVEPGRARPRRST